MTPRHGITPTSEPKMQDLITGETSSTIKAVNKAATRVNIHKSQEVPAIYTLGYKVRISRCIQQLDQIQAWSHQMRTYNV